MTNDQENASQKKTSASPENFDLDAFKNLVDNAGKERKNLQLLVEYFDRISSDLHDKKVFFDKASTKIPEALARLDTFDKRFQEVKTMDVRVRDFQRLAKELDSNHGTLKRKLDELHLLSEHIDHKIKSLTNSRPWLRRQMKTPAASMSSSGTWTPK